MTFAKGGKMGKLRDRGWFTSLCFCLATMTAVIASVPDDTVAGIVASRATDQANFREQDLERIQGFLERKIVQQKLRDYGVSPQQAMDKVRRIGDKELHLLASRMERVPDGGSMVGLDNEGALLILLAMAVLVAVIMIVLLGVKVAVNEMLHRPPSEDASSPPATPPSPAE